MDWEMQQLEGGKFAFLCPTGTFLRANPDGTVDLGPTQEPFEIITSPDGTKPVAIGTRHGTFLSVVEGKAGTVTTVAAPKFSFVLVIEEIGRVTIMTEFQTYIRTNPPATPVSHWSASMFKKAGQVAKIDPGKDYWGHMRPQQQSRGG